MNTNTTEFKKGLEAAANYLRLTADDYEQMANRIVGVKSDSSYNLHTVSRPARFTPAELKERDLYVAQASLLRGQAQHIIALRG